MYGKSVLEEHKADQILFYFSTPDYELLVSNKTDTIFFDRAIDIPRLIAKLRQDLTGKLIVGAIPFDINEAGRLYITDTWKENKVPFVKRSDLSDAPVNRNDFTGKTYLPSCEEYMKMVEKGVEYINGGKLNKVVLSREMKVKFHNPIDINSILRSLYSRNPLGYTYLLNAENSKSLIGASPEMLVSKRGPYLYSNPLAGSRPRGSNPEEDRKLAQELQNSRKDLAEHKFVVEDIVKKISPICKNVAFPEIPELLYTEQLWHLSSHIQGELINSDFTALDAALTIHPTPAICGVPQAEAYKRIKELERNNRGLFTGIIGWCDENGDGDWAIAIRGATVEKDSIFIRAGAGIVRDSIPQEELNETEVKFRTMLKGINLSEIKEHELEDGN